MARRSRNSTASYTKALNGCDGDAYAGLFATPGGYFGSSTRGEVRERQALIGLVKSEARCQNPAPAAAAPGARAGGGPASPRPAARRPEPVRRRLRGREGHDSNRRGRRAL